ncbi:MAG: SWIM zinc finger family protein [Methanoregula sp.]|jgi:predicted nucleic acid-binding Zn finger protein
MTDLWQHLAEKKALDETLREEIIGTCGARGTKALAAIDGHRVKKYLDFFVVSGATSDYIVDEQFCTCNDFVFRNHECWHLVAVRIALATGLFDRIDAWYQEKWKK